MAAALDDGTRMNLEPREALNLLARLASEPTNGWSIGTFGVSGEFSRDAQEPAIIDRDDDLFIVATARGALRIAPTGPVRAIAYETLLSDGEGWSHALAICVERPATTSTLIQASGVDEEAIRQEDRDSLLFDMGVANGAVRMCVRTRDPRLVDTLRESCGHSLLDKPAVLREVLRAQPHRVLLSPVGRVEVFQPIPAPGGKSPDGPHTHVLPKLIPKRRPHSSSVPIPDGWQAALTLHPPSPWSRFEAGRRHYEPRVDHAFVPLLNEFGLPEDRDIRDELVVAVTAASDPASFAWPASRRGRIAARITLRRLAAARIATAISWRARFDRVSVEDESDDEG